MTGIVTRAGKGSTLTFQELDGNFTYLDQNKVTIGDTTSSSLVEFIQNGGIAKTVQQELRKLIRVSQFPGVDFGVQLTNALATMPAAGGIIDATDITGTQTVSSTITVTKPVVIYLGAYTIALGTNQVLVQVSSAGFIGLPKADENNSLSRFTYAGIGEAIQFKNTTISTPIFGNVWKNVEVDAIGAAISSATSVGVAFYGTRYDTIENPEVYNFKQGIGLYFTGNGPGAGFGSTHLITNPAISTNKVGFFVSSAGGSASTHGNVFAGFIGGGTNPGVVINGFDIACESWRIYGTDCGTSSNTNSNGIILRSGADDCILFSPRQESAYNGIVINSGVNRTQIIAPVFITIVNAKIIDNGTDTVVLGGSNGPFGKGFYFAGSVARVSIGSVLTHQFSNGTFDIFGQTSQIRIGDNQDTSLARDANGNLVLTPLKQTAFGSAALSTNATIGFPCMQTCTGTPSGVPENIPSGQVPWVYDSTNNIVYIYNGAWKKTTALT